MAKKTMEVKEEETVVLFETRNYGNGEEISLTRREKGKYSMKGLPPDYTSTMHLKKSEINNLIKVLQHYANEIRDKNLQSDD